MILHEENNRPTSALESLASEIMELFAASNPTKSDVERVLGRYMKQEGDFAVSEQRFTIGTKRKSENQINYTRSKDLQLQILDKISVPVFTKEPIKGEHCGPLKVALVDNHSGEVVTYGPEASAKVKIVVLEADVGGCLGEFKNKIVTKEGKGQLLIGNVVVHLNKGTGFIGSIYFPQTRIWKTKQEYRLGVMVEDDSIETKVREGITESFYVKDRRLLLENKHYPPKPASEVWRLKGIAKDGPFHRRLSKFNINTVEDFLKELNMSPQRLHDILGKNMSPKLREGLVAHALTCIPDERLQLCSTSRSQQKTNALSVKTAELEVIKMQNTPLCRMSVLESMIERSVIQEFELAPVKRRRGKEIQSTEETVSGHTVGAGLLGEITCTDNSNWTRSCIFSPEEGVNNFDGLSVREMEAEVDNFDGISVGEVEPEASIGGDLHGESWRKHHPPALHGEAEKEEAHNMVIDAFRNSGEIFTSDNNAPRLTVSSHLFSNTLYPNPAKARSPDTVPSTDATGDIYIPNQVKFHDFDNMDIGDTFLNFTRGDFCEDEYFPIFGADYALLNSTVHNYTDVHSFVHNFSLPHVR